MPDPQQIQYPIGYQPYQPPIQYPMGYQPYTVAEPTPIGQSMAARTGMYTPDWMQSIGSATAPTTTVSAQRAGMYVPEWMQTVGKIGSGIYEGTLGGIFKGFGKSYEDINKSVDEGNYRGALGTALSPISAPFQGLTDISTNAIQGKNLLGFPEGMPEEERRREAMARGMETLGVSADDFREAMATGDIPRLAGQSIGVVGGLALGGRPRMPHLPAPRYLESIGIGRLPVEAAPPAPRAANIPEVMDPRQPRLPGMEQTDFTQQVSEPQMPASPSTDPMAQAHAAIDAQAQQRIFELTLDRAEAQRAGNGAAITQIDNAILEAKMDAAAQKRNWQSTVESQGALFPEISGEQAGLNFGAVRGPQGRFQPAGEFAYEGTTRPTPFSTENPLLSGQPRYPPVESMANVRPDVPIAPETPVTPEVAPSAELPRVIPTPFDATELALRKAEGYVTNPAVRGPNGELQMVLGARPQPVVEAPVTPAPVVTGGARKGIGHTPEPGADIPVPTERANQPGYIENMLAEGYTLVENRNGVSTFRHSSKMGGGTRMGMLDIGEAINIIARGVRDVRDSALAGKLRAVHAELVSRRSRGEGQISSEEFSRVTAGVPNLEEVAREMGVDLPDLRRQVGEAELSGATRGLPDMDAIQNATTREEVQEIINQWNNEWNRRDRSQEINARSHAHDMRMRAYDRLEVIMNERTRQVGEVQPPIQGRVGTPIEATPRPTQGTGLTPDQYIRDATTTEELDALSEHYIDELQDARTQDERNNILNLQTFIEQRRNELLNASEARTRTTTPDQDAYEIRRATTLEQLRPIRDRWNQEYYDAAAAGDRNRRNHAHDMYMLAYDRIDEINYEPPPPRPTRAETITNLENEFRRAIERDDVIRARTNLEYELADAVDEGDVPSQTRINQLLDEIRRLPPNQEPLNLQKRSAAEKYPIVEGQQPLYKGPVEMEAEAYDDLANHARVRQLQLERSQATTEQLARHHLQLAKYDPVWDDWARIQLSYVQDGPPGLSITKEYSWQDPTPENQTATYKIVYRGPDGKPVGTATVEQRANGVRLVPTLAVDRFKDIAPGQRVSRGILVGRAVKQIGMKLVDLGAAFTGGAGHSISVHTANLIEGIKRMVKSGVDERSVELASMIRRLLRMKEIESGPPRRIRTPEDLTNYIAEMIGEAAPQPELPFDPKVSRRTPTAAELENIPEQMRLTEEVREEQMPLPLENKLKSASDAGFIDIESIGKVIRGFFAKGPKTPEHPKGTPSTFEQFIGLPTAATTIADLSMPLRQGLATILTPEWRNALKPMFKSALSGEYTKTIHAELKNNKVNRRRFDEQTGKWEDSYAEDAGVPLIENNQVSGSEHNVASTWIETGGSIPYLSKAYRESWGRVARMSNRAAATFLNHLRTHTLERLSDSARDMAVKAEETGYARPGFRKQKFTPEQAGELNPYNNAPLAKIIGDFVNTATGRAPLKLDILPGLKLDMEFAAGAMGKVLFSPRNMFSRARMMNPMTYVMAPPMVRKQYMKAALSTAIAWYTMTQLVKTGAEALGYDATVSNDEESADFGKMRIGNTRLDLGGGFLQFYTAANRLWSGYYRSSATGKRHAYGEGFRPETQGTQLERFGVNKLNPVAKFIYDVGHASQYNPVHMGDRALQLFIPLAVQDFYEIMNEDPKLVPLLMPEVMLGGGTQIYEKGESIAKFIPKKYDWIVKGGGLSDVVNPMNWQLFGGK